MTFNRSILAFDDLKPHLDSAIASEKGIRIVCNTYSQAVILRARINYFRKADRDANGKIYEEGHALYKRSIYDKLVVRVPKKGTQNEHCVYLEKRSPEDWKVEEIT